MGLKNDKKRVQWAACLLLLLVFCNIVGCATMGAPSGGPKDSLPPVVKFTKPGVGATNFTGKRIEIGFSEFVKLKDQQKLFFVSPQQNKNAQLSIRGQSVLVNFQDTLQPNQTYRLDFGSSIVDNNEGNAMDGFTYTFSTGSAIDSLMMVGQVVDAYSRDTISGAFLAFYYAVDDSLNIERGGLDSTLFKRNANALFRSDSSGYFVADILKGEPYYIYSILDLNGNQRYDTGVDMVGFVDAAQNPLDQHGFSFAFDSVRRQWYIDSLQVSMGLFREPREVRQNFMGQSRSNRVLLQLDFAAPGAKVDSVELRGGVPQEWLREQWNPTRDTLSYWISTPTLAAYDSLPDSLQIAFVFEGLDSLGGPSWVRREAKFFHRSEVDSASKPAVEVRLSARERRELEAKQRRDSLEFDSVFQRVLSLDSVLLSAFSLDSASIEPLLADSLALDSLKLSVRAIRDSILADTIPYVNPFVYSLNIGKEFSPLDTITFEFPYPLQSLDSAGITLLKGTPIGGRRPRTSNRRDQANIEYKFEPMDFHASFDGLRKLQIITELEPNTEYELVAEDSIFLDFAWQTNDSTSMKFKTLNPDDFGSFVVDFSGPTPTDSTLYILELVEVKGKTVVGPEELKNEPEYTVVRRIRDALPGQKYRFDYLKNATYKLRVVEDKNADGQWNSGTLTTRTQPERVDLWRHPETMQPFEFEAKENREFIEKVDLLQLFPGGRKVTTETIENEE